MQPYACGNNFFSDPIPPSIDATGQHRSTDTHILHDLVSHEVGGGRTDGGLDALRGAVATAQVAVHVGAVQSHPYDGQHLWHGEGRGQLGGGGVTTQYGNTHTE